MNSKGILFGRGISFVMGWFFWRNWKLVFIVEGVRFLGKNCIIFEICDNCIIEREEKYLKYKEFNLFYDY